MMGGALSRGGMGVDKVAGKTAATQHKLALKGKCRGKTLAALWVSKEHRSARNLKNGTEPSGRLRAALRGH